MQSIGERIRIYRKKKGYKVKNFADLIGISQGSLSDIENDNTKPAAETLASLVRNTDIDSRWLLTGEKAKEEDVLTPEEREYLEKLLIVLRNPDTKEAIQKNVDTFLKVPKPAPFENKKKGVKAG